MSKYGNVRTAAPPKSRREPHPVWRGIGCLMMLFLPVISYAISMLTVDEAMRQGIRLPEGLVMNPVMPEFLFRVPGLVDLLYWIQAQDHLYAYLLVAFFILVLLGGIFSFAYALLYRVVGPPAYSQFDAPPPKVKVKKYRR